MIPSQKIVEDAERSAQPDDAPSSYLDLLLAIEQRLSCIDSTSEPSDQIQINTSTTVEDFLSGIELLEDMCRYPQIRSRLMSIRHCVLPRLADHSEPALLASMSGKPPSPTGGARAGSSTEDSANPPVMGKLPIEHYLRMPELSLRSNVQSPHVPTTPTQTPALSNDVPIGPVSSRKLIKGLEAVQSRTKGGVVQQPRFEKRAEQQAEAARESGVGSGTRVEKSDSHQIQSEDTADAARERMSQSKNLMKDWDDGQVQMNDRGEMPEQPKALGNPNEQEVNDRRPEESGATIEVQSDKGKKPMTETEMDTKEAEGNVRRDSAWKSRQGSQPEPQSPTEH